MDLLYVVQQNNILQLHIMQMLKQFPLRLREAGAVG